MVIELSDADVAGRLCAAHIRKVRQNVIWSMEVCLSVKAV